MAKTIRLAECATLKSSAKRIVFSSCALLVVVARLHLLSS